MNRRMSLAAGCVALAGPVILAWGQPCVNFADIVFYDTIGYDNPTCVASGDIDNDGHTDLVIATRFGTGVLVFQYGLGAGQYSDPVIVSNFGGDTSGTNWCTLLDFNDDGNLDLALARRNGPFQLFQGSGDGAFQLVDEASTIEDASCAIAADFDGDGRDDILLSGSGGARVLFIDLNGQVTSTFDILSGSAFYPFAADIDADGDVDILIPAGSARRVRIYENSGFGTFELSVSISTGFTTPTSMVAADFDIDGDLDLAAAIIDGSINFYENLGEGEFGDAIVLDIPQAQQDPWHLATSDLNDDDLPDLVFTGGVTQRIGIMMNLSTAGDILFSVAQLNQCSGLPNMSLAMDYDADGDLDIVSPTLGEGESPIALIENLTSGTACYADVSGDGTIDVNDVVEVFLEWGKSVSHADLNKDSIVNGVDLSIVLNNWGEL